MVRIRGATPCRYRSAAWSSRAWNTGDGSPSYCAAPSTTMASAAARGRRPADLHDPQHHPADDHRGDQRGATEVAQHGSHSVPRSLAGRRSAGPRSCQRHARRGRTLVASPRRPPRHATLAHRELTGRPCRFRLCLVAPRGPRGPVSARWRCCWWLPFSTVAGSATTGDGQPAASELVGEPSSTADVVVGRPVRTRSGPHQLPSASCTAAVVAPASPTAATGPIGDPGIGDPYYPTGRQRRIPGRFLRPQAAPTTRPPTRCSHGA